MLVVKCYIILETDLFPCKDSLLPINVVCFIVGLFGNLYSVAGDCTTICSILWSAVFENEQVFTKILLESQWHN